MATLIPAGVEIPWTGLKNGSITNKDGHGFAIASEEHGIEIFKSMVFAETEAALKVAREKHGINSIVMFHSRWGTHGEYGEYNVHPFVVEEDDEGNIITVMCHNGVLPSKYHPAKEKRSGGGWNKELKKHVPGEVTEPGDRRSDTRIFVDEEAVTFCDTALGVPTRSGGKKIGKIIGSGNKLVFLSIKSGLPKARLINAHMGDFIKGVWFSNSGYKYGCGGTRSASSGTTRTSVGNRYSWGDDYSYAGAGDDWWGEGEYVPGVREVGRTESSQPSQSSSLFNLDGYYAKCSKCLEFEVDTATNICVTCDWCHDCDMEFESCLCFYAGEAPKAGDLDGAMLDKLYEAWCNKEISDEDYDRGFSRIFPGTEREPASSSLVVIEDSLKDMVKVDGKWVRVDSLIGN